jgi:phosphoribosylanthranilate isomerase
MTRPLLKVCGLRLPEQAREVAALGADAIGVIGVVGSPRHLDPSHRKGLFAAVADERPQCQRVLVVADPGNEDLALLDPEAGGHQVVQLHGAETPERCQELKRQVGGVTWWKALRIRTPDDLNQAIGYAAVVDALLLDAWVPDQLGGTGQCLPLEWLMAFQASVPWWLAGGVTPERVPGLLRTVRPAGLDASSGVEDAPGLKNLERVAALVRAVHTAGEQAS